VRRPTTTSASSTICGVAEDLGWWQVPTFTKTSDGIEGKVARYVRKPTCRHSTLTAIQALALTELDLLGCALGVGGTDERLSAP
jgi:hypothetical protein